MEGEGCREAGGERERSEGKGREGKGETCHTNPSLLPAPLFPRYQGLLFQFLLSQVCHTQCG